MLWSHLHVKQTRKNHIGQFSQTEWDMATSLQLRGPGGNYRMYVASGKHAASVPQVAITGCTWLVASMQQACRKLVSRLQGSKNANKVTKLTNQERGNSNYRQACRKLVASLYLYEAQIKIHD